MNLQQKCGKLYEKICRIVDKALFSESIRDQITNRGLNLFFICYAFSGGFLFDENINQWFRKSWLIYQIASSMAILICSIFYFTDILMFDYQMAVIGSAPLIVVLMKIMIYVAIYYNRRRVTEMMKFFLNDTYTSSVGEGILINARKKAIAIIVGFLIICFVMDISFDEKALIGDKKYTKNYHMIQYFPTWCPYPDSILMYYAIRVFKIVAMVPNFNMFMFCYVFNWMVIAETHNKFAILSYKLESISNYVFEELQRMEKVQQEAMKLNKSRFLWAEKKLKKERDQLMDAFYIDFVNCLRRYQQLRRMAQSPKRYLEGYYSMVYVYIFILSVFMGFVLMMSWTNKHPTGLESKSRITSAVGALGIQFFWWYDSCVHGHLFKDTIEMISEVVYSMPWYHFSPKRRKVVLTFLTLVQWPLELRVWKIVLLTKDVLPEYLDSIVSHVQIMITLQRKRYAN